MIRYSTDFLRVVLLLFVLSVSPQSVSAQSFELSGLALDAMYGAKINWVDLDSDADLDIISTGFTNTTGDYATIVYQNNNGLFSKVITALPSVRNGAFSWGDFDNDNDPDILITGVGAAGNLSAVYENLGAFTFSLKQSLTPLQKSTCSWVDLDNDTDLDLIIAGEEFIDGAPQPLVARTLVYENNAGTFTLLSNTNLPACVQCAISWADANADGYVDVVISGFRSDGAGRSSFYINNGDKTFRLDTGIKLKNTFNGDITWGDFDNDGDVDVLQTGPEQGNASGVAFSTLFQNGIGTWKTRTDIVLPAVGENYLGGTKWFDYDNDGVLDLILSGRPSTSSVNSYFKILKNDGAGNFSEIANLPGIVDGSVDFGDYDNDGDADICFVGMNEGVITAGIYNNMAAASAFASNTKPSPPDAASLEERNAFRRQVVLSWNSGSDNETPVNGLSYNVYLRNNAAYSIAPSANFSTGFIKTSHTPNGQGKKIFATNIAEGDVYWSVQAIDGGKEGSDFVTEKHFYHINGPQAIKAQIIDPSQVKLFWSDNSLVETNYRIDRSAGNTTSFTTLATIAANTSDYTDAGTLLTETFYYYRIFATEGANESGYDSLMVVIPQSPVNLVATIVNATTVSLMWTDRTKYESGYVVERKRSDESGFTVIANLAGGKVAYTNTGLDEGTYYEYRVRAINAYGGSAFTNIVSAVTNFIPTSFDIELQTYEDNTVSISSDEISANFQDGDLTDALAAIRIESIPEAGLLTLAGNTVAVNDVIAAGDLDNLVYSPPYDESGAYQMSIRVSDGKDFSMSSSLVTIIVLPVNDAPSFYFTETIELFEDFTDDVIFSPLAFWPADEIDQAVIFSIDPPVSDVVTISLDETTGEILFAALPDKEGTATFVLTADDGQSENNIFSQEFSVVIYPVNDAPVIAELHPIEHPVNEAIPLIPIPVTDMDNELSALVISAVSDNQALLPDANISVSFEGDEFLLGLTTSADVVGKTNITITADDGDLTTQRSFKLTVSPVLGTAPEIEQLNVYPNPAGSTLVLRGSHRGEIELISATGKDVSKFRLTEEGQPIDVSKLNAGLYLIRLVNEQGRIFIGKFVKR